MKEACEGEYRQVAWKCAMEMDVQLFWSSELIVAWTTAYIVFTYLIFISPFVIYCVHFSNHLALSHSHTFPLSFCHNSKYPVGPGCGLLLLAYLALGSI